MTFVPVDLNFFWIFAFLLFLFTNLFNLQVSSCSKGEKKETLLYTFKAITFKSIFINFHTISSCLKNVFLTTLCIVDKKDILERRINHVSLGM